MPKRSRSGVVVVQSTKTKAKAKPANKKNLKKTSKKGAYAPKAKKEFRKRRQPFVETSKREHAEVAKRNIDAGIDPVAHPLYAAQPLLFYEVPNDDAYTHLNLASFYRMKQGLTDGTMKGDAVYSRFLKCKVDVKFPDNMDTIIKPNKVFLIQGWCKSPISATASRGVVGGTGTTTETIIASDVLLHIANTIKQYFNEDVDRLRFRDKIQTDLVVLRKDLLLPNHNAGTAMGPQLRGESGFVGINGAIPTIHRSYTWKVNKKIHYTQGTGQDGKAIAQDNSVATDIQNMYLNNNWLPFLILYSPDFSIYKNAVGEDNAPSPGEKHISIRYNDCHWFGDS